ncbi:DUF2164 domain-containing protein [Shewanella sp. SNU WT4]|uniref:DUF2164 domain-containing protein n=1 Tax=Shewanella sp. SNU WT4 TaxID=2590015 RepID=UPI00143DDFB4|nr:DUF2164 domain-containing protein [Shewanella sp. SNU WT4]
MAITPLESKVKQALIASLQTYIEDELNQDIGQFEAEFLLDFITEKVSAHWYNQGLQDARVLMHSTLLSCLDDIEEAVDAQQMKLG